MGHLAKATLKVISAEDPAIFLSPGSAKADRERKGDGRGLYTWSVGRRKSPRGPFLFDDGDFWETFFFFFFFFFGGLLAKADMAW